MKTAVEWLFKNIWLNPPENLYEILDQAKEMEKQQIIDACDYGKESLFKGKYLKSEQYYNETFKNK